ncbi:VOC family protein [Lyngbya confervoides]|uniref:VOC family protein n=1 Tax=Lyngbya confervoides BDU141951 TaxID=1574623 RepID=A0ABD4TAH3_9CYAN|nr:VOC family protein [Lyngbya confervoides]MCM1985298.1 VOC family protein [Lyngbya confervoides BDU141951]
MTVTEFLHAALPVQDLGRSRQFYEGILGLCPSDRPLSFPGLWYSLGKQQLHLIESSLAPADALNTERWGRNRHLAFAVTDLGTCQRQLELAGYPVQPSASGRPALFTQDPDGHIIELSQRDADDG